ncbi:MAG: VCBS repeat-containing protein [Solitalea sp.]
MKYFLLAAIPYFFLAAKPSDPPAKDTPTPVFKAQVVDDQVAIGYGLAIGDVDGDRKPDILLADKKEIVWYRNGDWKRFVMAKDLTTHDNVCIAARDINGDGLVEVAVGAQWNPGETSDTAQSGAVFYLHRPQDPTQLWKPEKLYHEPTVHRMGWVEAAPDVFQLIVLPLHGRGNTNGEGEGVRVMAYTPPGNNQEGWRYKIIDRLLHMTHNFEIVPGKGGEALFVGGKEGIRKLKFEDGQWAASWLVNGPSFGELRVGRDADGRTWLTGIEPMHGNNLTVYLGLDTAGRQVLTAKMNQGHGLATGDLTGSGNDQIVAGWRNPDEEGKVGIQLWQQESGKWKPYRIDDNEMACEDLKIADLDGDGRPEIIAAGRATHNLVIYWNRTDASDGSGH